MLWRDGKVIRGEPAPDPSLTGWGAFSTVGCDRGRPLLWERHRARLAASLAHLGAGADVLLPDEPSLRGLLADNGLGGPARLRVVGCRVGTHGWVVEASVSSCDLTGPRVPPIRLIVEQWSSAPPLIGHKTLARLPWDLARKRAIDRGADDALLVEGAGRVLETAIANVWIVAGSELRTPPAPTHCLPGVMRGWLLERAAELGLDVSETGVRVADVEDADEVWLSNAVVGVRRVGRVEDREWQRWPIFEGLETLAVPAPGWRGATENFNR
jgi:branched-subunit amino acid aminotransferase/4-amino-4-deoxychorismate lyase